MGKTKKVGITGRFGSRYGRKTKMRLKEVETLYRGKKYECPNCRAVRVKRVSTAVWQCLKCGLKFAGGAYMPFPPIEAIKLEGAKIVPVSEFKKAQEEEKPEENVGAE